MTAQYTFAISDRTMSEAVSCEFWTAAIRLLVRGHGPRSGTAEQYEELREALAKAEATFMRMRPAPPKGKKCKPSGN